MVCLHFIWPNLGFAGSCECLLNKSAQKLWNFLLLKNLSGAWTHYPNLCRDTCFVTGIDKKRKEIPLAPIYNEELFGCNEGCISAWVPGFHPLSGGDVTERFDGEEKMTFWKVLEEPDPEDDKIQALLQLHVVEQSSESTIVAIEAFFVNLYLPHTELTKVADARWWLFKKERGIIRGSLPPPKKSCSSSYNACPLPGNNTIQYNYNTIQYRHL